MIFTIDSDSEERRDQINEWFDASQRQRIAEALLDENGSRPTEAALDVIMAVVEALDDTDETWDGPGTPGLRRYVANVKRGLTAMVDNMPVTR